MEMIIQKKLATALSPLVLEIEDESHKHAGHVGARPGISTHFHIQIVSDAFTPLSRVERHRLIHDILKEELAGPIHALSLSLRSPKETQ
jgi:BolA protein